MEQDERLLPFPKTEVLQTINNNNDYPAAYSPFNDEESFESKRSIREYLNVIYKRLPLIIALTILTTAVVALYMYRQPSIYQAVAEIIIEARKPKPQSKDSINISFGNDQLYYNTQLKLLQNPELMRNVVVRLGLHRDPSLLDNQNRGLLTTVRSMFSGGKNEANKESSLPILTETSSETTNNELTALTPEEKLTTDRYAGMLLGGLSVDQVEQTNIIKLSLKSTSPDLSAKVINMAAKIFIEQDIVRETQGAKRDYEDLSKSIEELKGTIAGQEQDRINYMRDHTIPLREGKGTDLLADRLQKISTDWLSAEDERRKLQAKYEAAQKAGGGSGDILSVVGENQAIQAARERYLVRKAELEKRIETIDSQIQNSETEMATLKVKYTAEHPSVKRVEAQIKSLEESREKISTEVRQSIETEGKTLIKNTEREVLTSIQAQLQAAQRREAQLKTAYFQETASANTLGQAETRLTTLTREIETNRSLLDSYIQQQKQRELQISSSRPDNIKISAEAQTPEAPIGPTRNRNIIIAFLISLSTGIGLAFLMDYLDDSIKNSDDIGRHLGLPTLALIPYESGMEKRKGLLAAKNGSVSNVASSTAMIAITDKRSAMAESYRHLRTSLLFSSAGKPPQTILVTSSQPAEGKTTTAINTAITLAQSGADVVIIDCDLRRPRLHSHFDMQNTTGLTNYLSGEKNTQNLMKPFPELPNLKVITSGPIPPNPAELLSSNEMKNLLQHLKGSFKHVVIDSPPAISFTDAAILSTIVDGVVLVAMAGKSSIHLMRRFKHRLANIGARIYGVVLNGLKADSAEYGYYGYGYTYNYYSLNEDDTSTPRMEDMEEWEDVLSVNKQEDVLSVDKQEDVLSVNKSKE